MGWVNGFLPIIKSSTNSSWGWVGLWQKVSDKDPQEIQNLFENINIPNEYPEVLKEDDKTEIFNQHLPKKCKTLNFREILTTKESNMDIKCDECEKIIKHKKTNDLNNINCERCNQSFQLLFNLNKHQKECFYHCELCQFKHRYLSLRKKNPVLKVHLLNKIIGRT